MGKLEDVLKQKFKESLLTAERNNLIELTEYLLEKLWKIPKERQNLIENIQISGIATKPESQPKKRGRKPKGEPEPKPEPVSKVKPKPKAEPKPKKEKKPKPMKQTELSDEQIVKAIAKELGDEPEETIEVAEPPREPTEDFEEPVPEPPKPQPEKTETHFVRSTEEEEVDGMMK